MMSSICRPSTSRCERSRSARDLRRLCVWKRACMLCDIFYFHYIESLDVDRNGKGRLTFSTYCVLD